jgi:hypothetical protein
VSFGSPPWRSADRIGPSRYLSAAVAFVFSDPRDEFDA